ncbi:MAG: Hsp20/alpha crystallin family protein [Pontibacterium sp.]
MGELTRFNSLFDDTFMNDFFWPRRHRGSKELMPAIDVHEGEEGYVIKADLPGVEKDGIKVNLENGVLTITAETHQEEKEENEGKLIRQERHFGRYMRSMSVGTDIDPGKIKARFENGVLSLELPKVEKEKPAGVSVDIE